VSLQKRARAGTLETSGISTQTKHEYHDSTKLTNL